ncbi:MAG: V-type ATP synthase subunit I [Clostridia bacterium]
MSIVNMSRMSLVAHSTERSKLLRIFLKSGCVEIVRSESVLVSDYIEDETRHNLIESKRLRIAFALDFIKEMAKQYKSIDEKNVPKINLKKENRLVDLDEYYSTPKHEIEIFGDISEMESINSALVDIKGDISRNNALKEQLQIYDLVDMPFNEIKDTKFSHVMLGLVPILNVETVKQGLQDIAEVENYDKDRQSVLIVVCHNYDLEQTNNVLNENGFVSTTFDIDMTASEKIAELDEANEQLENKRDALITQGVEYSNRITQLKVAYDYYLLEITKMDIMASCPQTGKAFIMEAWLPTEKIEAIKKLVESKCKFVEVVFRDPLETEQPPSLTKNNKFVSSFSGLTDMYGSPNYREGDPNLFVAMFYFVFFGIMISDAGYGLLIAIFCFLTVKLTKPVKNSGKMLIMFGWCGVSTVIWGALFGGWFGITPTTTILAKLVWFNPLEEPLKMFMLALGMGVLQIGTGFALNGIETIKKGKVLSGILNNFSWDIILLGIVFIAPNLMVFLGAINPDPIPQAFGVLATIGKYTAVSGFVLLLVGGAVGKKNPVKMVAGAFGNAYGAINVVSDLLSYSRLFGLGLTTGVIGYVVNMLAKDIIVDTFFHGMWVGWIFAAGVLLVGHTFNLAINFLGAYVHNSRLQYIEFFGRFYEGSGHAFNPIGSKTKYTYLDN